MHHRERFETLWSIQYLRAAAALMVVWHHALHQVEDYEALLPRSSFGANGVDLFFVISGLIMVLTTQGRDVSPWDFARRRLIRIVPLYWLVTIGIVIGVSLAPGLFKTTDIGWRHVAQSLLFIPHYSPSFPSMIWPVLVPGWSLNYEMFFYGLFALCLFLPARRTVPAVLTLLGSLVAAGALWGPFADASLVSYTNPMLLQFGCGVVIGWLHCHQRLDIGPWLAAGLGATGTVLLCLDISDAYRLTALSGSAALVLSALSPAVAGWQSEFWRRLGDASYSIYLIHIPALGVARLLYLQLASGESSLPGAASFMLVALTLSCAAGCLCHRLLELPLLAALSRRRASGARG